MVYILPPLRIGSIILHGDTTMTYATLRMDGKEFVLVPKTEFGQLTAQDRRDAQKAQRALAQFRAGKLRTLSHTALKRELGL